jgi:hypothetical protein
MADHAIGSHRRPIDTTSPHRPQDTAGVRIDPSARTRLDSNHNGAVSGTELDKGLQSGIVHYKDNVVVPTGKSVKPVALFDDTTQPAAKAAAKPAKQAAWSEADAKALRQDMQKVVQESYNPPKVQTEDAQSRALRADMQNVVQQSYNPPKIR